jgi:hypothetical protein
MQHRTITRIGAAALIAGLVGFSSAGFAQQDALDAYRAQDNVSNETASTVPQAHPKADAISRDLAAYEQRADDSVVGAPRSKVTTEQNALLDRIAELRSDLDAYYGENSFDNTQASDVPMARHRTAREISENLARFEENGGSLNTLTF